MREKATLYLDRRKLDAKVIYGDGGGHRILSKIYTTIDEKLGSIVIRRMVLSMRVIICDGKMIDCYCASGLKAYTRDRSSESVFAIVCVSLSKRLQSKSNPHLFVAGTQTCTDFPANMLSLIIRANL